MIDRAKSNITNLTLSVGNSFPQWLHITVALPSPWIFRLCISRKCSDLKTSSHLSHWYGVFFLNLTMWSVVFTLWHLNQSQVMRDKITSLNSHLWILSSFIFSVEMLKNLRHLVQWAKPTSRPSSRKW